MDDQLLLIICCSAIVAALGYFLPRLWTAKGKQGRLRGRLQEGPYGRLRDSKPQLAKLLQRLGQAAAEPFMPKKTENASNLNRSLARAGIYSPSAFRVLIGAKVLCLAS